MSHKLRRKVQHVSHLNDQHTAELIKSKCCRFSNFHKNALDYCCWKCLNNWPTFISDDAYPMVRSVLGHTFRFTVFLWSPPHIASGLELLFSLSLVWTGCWTNDRGADDLRNRDADMRSLPWFLLINHQLTIPIGSISVVLHMIQDELLLLPQTGHVNSYSIDCNSFFFSAPMLEEFYSKR